MNPSSVARVAVATVLSALCGYVILYLAARDLDWRMRYTLAEMVDSAWQARQAAS